MSREGARVRHQLLTRNRTSDDIEWATSRRLDRIGQSYVRTLGPRFSAHLRELTRRLGSRGHWIDMGSGGNFALAQYLEAPRWRGPRGRMRVTGIAMTAPENARDIAAIAPSARALYGRMLSEYSVAELGRADLITDVWGVASYADRLDEVVAQYALILREGGEAHIYLQASTVLGARAFDPPADTTSTSVGDPRAVEQVRAWLSTATGIEARVESLRIPAFGGRSHPDSIRLVVRRTTGPISIDALRVRRISADVPPLRDLEPARPRAPLAIRK